MKVPMTKLGAERLFKELEHLKKVKRPEIIKHIAEARAHGDLKENAEFKAAKEEQSHTEGRIKELEHKLAHSHVIDSKMFAKTGKVVFGSTVTIINCDTDETLKYQIVGTDEADIKESKISVESPIAKGLIGKVVGDIASIRTPKGIAEYEVDAIDYC